MGLVIVFCSLHLKQKTNKLPTTIRHMQNIYRTLISHFRTYCANRFTVLTSAKRYCDPSCLLVGSLVRWRGCAWAAFRAPGEAGGPRLYYCLCATFAPLVVWVYIHSNFSNGLRKAGALYNRINYCPPRSSKVVDFGTSRKRVCIFPCQ